MCNCPAPIHQYFLTDYDEEEGEVPEEKQIGSDKQPSSTEINSISEKLEKVMEEGELKESDLEEGEMKDSDVEEGEIKDDGEEGEILSDSEVRNVIHLTIFSWSQIWLILADILWP